MLLRSAKEVDAVVVGPKSRNLRPKSSGRAPVDTIEQCQSAQEYEKPERLGSRKAHASVSCSNGGRASRAPHTISTPPTLRNQGKNSRARRLLNSKRVRCVRSIAAK